MTLGISMRSYTSQQEYIHMSMSARYLVMIAIALRGENLRYGLFLGRRNGEELISIKPIKIGRNLIHISDNLIDVDRYVDNKNSYHCDQNAIHQKGC